MSEVKRYGRIGDMVEATEGLLKLYPMMSVYVLATDFDRVTAERDAALAENKLLRHDVASYLETVAKVCDMLGVDLESAKTAEGKPSDVLFGYVIAMQQRLTAADERVDELEGVLRDSKDVMSGIWDASYDHDAGDALAALDLMERIDAALKPAEAARCTNCDRSTVEQCDDAGCGFLGAGNGAPEEGAGSTCNQIREETGLPINHPCKACNGGACIDR